MMDTEDTPTSKNASEWTVSTWSMRKTCILSFKFKQRIAFEVCTGICNSSCFRRVENLKIAKTLTDEQPTPDQYDM